MDAYQVAFTILQKFMHENGYTGVSEPLLQQLAKALVDGVGQWYQQKQDEAHEAVPEEEPSPPRKRK